MPAGGAGGRRRIQCRRIRTMMQNQRQKQPPVLGPHGAARLGQTLRHTRKSYLCSVIVEEWLTDLTYRIYDGAHGSNANGPSRNARHGIRPPKKRA